MVIGVGGGSVIDTAKAIAHGAANPGCDLWDFWLLKTPLTKSLPVGAVVTIPAAGSEMSDSAVITNEETCESGVELTLPACLCRSEPCAGIHAAGIPGRLRSDGYPDAYAGPVFHFGDRQ